MSLRSLRGSLLVAATGAVTAAWMVAAAPADASAAACTTHVVDSPTDTRGLAFIGRVSDVQQAYSSIDADYAVDRYRFAVERVLRDPHGDPIVIETSWHCPGISFPRGMRLLVSTDDRLSALSWNTVAWKILPDGRVRLVLPIDHDGVAQEILDASTLSEAIDLIAPGLPNTTTTAAESSSVRDPMPLALVFLLAAGGALRLLVRRSPG